MSENDREREEELEALQAIFCTSETQLVITSTVSGYLDLPVTLSTPLSLVIDQLADTTADEHAAQQHSVSSLPHVRFEFALPEGYPNSAPPQIAITCANSWAPSGVAEELLATCISLSEDYGHAQVLFALISHVEEQANSAFEATQLTVTNDVLTNLLDFDRQQKKRSFDQETHDCGVCLDPKKGSACHRMEHCGHVFCVECLQDCYINAILQGNLDEVKCLSFQCGMENVSPQMRRLMAPRLIAPSELLRIPIERPAVQRLVDLKRKKLLETDPSTVWCPRKWCQGAAIDKKYPKPTVALEDMHDFPTKPESTAKAIINKEDKEVDKVTKEKEILADRLRTCEDCSYAFCKLCRGSWHGDHFDCRPRSESLSGQKQLSEEEQATNDFIVLSSTECPSCSTRVQKSEACNYMRCAQCYAHFCYLCGLGLDAADPYKHFSKQDTPCYQKLFILAEGDDGEGRDHFGGARAAEIAARQAAPIVEA
jgi:E3 ubiquitin-protein ligase RNF14